MIKICYTKFLKINKEEKGKHGQLPQHNEPEK